MLKDEFFQMAMLSAIEGSLSNPNNQNVLASKIVSDALNIAKQAADAANGYLSGMYSTTMTTFDGAGTYTATAATITYSADQTAELNAVTKAVIANVAPTMIMQPGTDLTIRPQADYSIAQN